MANGIRMNPGVGGELLATVDQSIAFAGFTTNAGHIQIGCLFVGADASTIPTPVTYSHPFPTVLQTGANVIGAVTQSGTWNVTVNAALPTGANVIGGVTQSGTWNVTVNAALPTGANVIGGVTQSGTWNVTVNAALPTGANVIGAVTQSGTWTVQPGNTQNTTPWLVQHHDGTNKQGTFFDLDSGVGTEWQQGVNLRTSASGGSVEAKGQKAMASSIPVALASDQAAIPVSQSGTWNATINTALPAGAATIGNVTITDLEVGLAAATAPSKMAVAGMQFNATVPAPTDTQTVALQSNSGAALFVTLEGRKRTYSVTSGNFVPQAAATDIGRLSGSSTKTVRVLKAKVILQSTNTAPGAIAVGFAIRSTANSGGTPVAGINLLAHDQNAAAATASATFWTANPTLGTLVGIYSQTLLPIMVTTGTTTQSVYELDFTKPGTEPLTLRGTAQGLSVSLLAGTVPATAGATIDYTWTEETNAV